MPADPKQDPEKKSTTLDQRMEEAREARLPMEKVWLENTAFYMGKQWLMWDDVLRILSHPRVPKWRVLMTVNKIQTYIWTEFAKMTQKMPNPVVNATADTKDAIRQAKTTKKVIQFLDIVTDMEMTAKRALLHSIVTGDGFLKNRWDKSLGDPVDDEGTMTGEVATDAVSPFELYWDPFGETIAEKYWVIHVKLRSHEYVLNKFGKDIEPTQYSLNEFVDGQLSIIMDQYQNAMREGILVKEYFERPNKNAPRGKYIALAGEEEMENGDNPEPDIGLPFVQIPNILVPGRFYGASKIEQMIDVQRNYNKSRSQAIEMRNLMARGKWLIPDGSLQPGKVITSAPGEMITYIPLNGLKPEMVPGIPVDQSFWKDLELGNREFMDVMGQHETTQGQAPGEVKSGLAIGRLQEQDDARIGPSADLWEKAYAECEKQRIMIARRHYAETRTGRIIGRGKRVEVFSFTRESLPENADITVESGSSLPKSRIARQQTIMELVDKGMFPDKKKAMEFMDLGDIEGMYDDLEMDQAQADRENDSMRTGKQATVEDYQDHETHVYEHNSYRKSEEYEELPQEIKDVFKQHVITHQEYLDQAQEQQILAQLRSRAKIIETGKVSPDQTGQLFGEKPQAPEGQGNPQQGTGATPPSPGGLPRQPANQ